MTNTLTVTTTPSVPSAALVAARAVGATKRYGSGDSAVTALDAVTVDFRAREFTAIMGPSGSGKSTLMHLIAGLDKFTSGNVYIGDTDLSELDDRRLTQLRRDKIGFIFQAFNLIPTLTAIENITLPIVARRSQARRASGSTTSSTPSGSASGSSHRPSELSGGQQQRVAVARALASQPGDHLRRRADRQPRFPHGRRDLVVHATRRRRPRPDDRDGHPRSGRRQLRPASRLPRRRPDRRPDVLIRPPTACSTA